MTSTAVTTMVMNRAAGQREADISVDVPFEDANGSRGLVTITGTLD
jgi:hypothetical protein